MSLSFDASNKGLLRDALRVACLVSLPLLPYLLTVLCLHYTAYNNSSDTFLYFDIAKNILAGRGFVTSFNVYQYWQGLCYPSLPFVHPVLSLFLAALYALFGSIQALILSNFVFAFFNLILLYRIVLRLYEDRVVASWVVVLVASTVCMEITLLRVLTEQMSLFVTLLAVYLFVPSREMRWPRLGAIGLLLGLGVLVRSASVIYPLAFALAFGLSGGVRKRLQAFFLLAAPLAIVGLYEGFVFLRYHVFFPEYPRAFKDYFLSTYADPMVRSFYGQNIMDMANVFSCVLRVLVIFSAWHFVRVFQNKRGPELLLFWLGILQASAPNLFYPYMRIGHFQWTRFLLLPVTFFIVFGIAEFRRFSESYFPRSKKILFHAMVWIVFVSNFYQSSRVLEVYWKEQRAGIKVEELTRIAAWAERKTAPLDLFAVSEYVIGGVYLDRPTIILPMHNMFNKKQLRSFLRTHLPKVIVFEKTLPMASFLDEEGYVQASEWPSDSLFFIYRRP